MDINDIAGYEERTFVLYMIQILLVEMYLMTYDINSVMILRHLITPNDVIDV